MLEILSQGFLGFRGDFLSDLLIVALALIVPALLIALLAARSHRRRLHRFLMFTVLSVVVAYVIVYEISMLAQGGISFLQGRIRMDQVPYFSTVAIHVLIALVALVIAVWAVRRGMRTFAAGGEEGRSMRSLHARTGYSAFFLLVVAVVTGLVVYYLTFVYTAANYVQR